MDVFGWLMLGLSVVFFTLGFVAMFGRVTGIPQHEGRGPMAQGVGFFLFGISRIPGLLGNEWLTWAGAACTVIGGVLDWRSRRTLSPGRAKPR